MRCPNCQNEEHDVLLIDCTLVGEARERRRFCYACRPVARSRYAGMHQMAIAKLGMNERDEAWAARRYVPDRRASYSAAERIFDLTAGTPLNARIS
jgi:transcriptional regulator NrdR family protein